ncbi:uncharacterized protein LOC131165365 [Malania oleifera]|uniref:uncharacterized protein LOC131165365 n=1 Tax=Malania oleifera TaxID=397392 RepID=UPI0025AE63FC|nr:uncharacterized protein LOC131165365 [Malania oleifera]
MKTENGSITHFNNHRTSRSALHSMREHLQNPNPTSQLHPRFYLKRRLHQPYPATNANVAYAQRSRPRIHRQRLDVERCHHVLRLACLDPACGDGREAELGAGVKDLQRAVVVHEGVVVRVLDGYLLRECEAGGAVGDGESREPHGVHSDLRVSGLEDGEVDDEDDGHNEE